MGFLKGAETKNVNDRNMFPPKTSPLIISCEFDDDSFVYFDSLRQKHFPAERNFIRAHLTLFHHLPGEYMEELRGDLREVTKNLSPVRLAFSSWRSLGRGVAMNVESSDLVALRNEIARRWIKHLTPQDKQPFHPHITVQNKVDPEAAKSLLATLSKQPLPSTGSATGLRLSMYLNGPWKTVDKFAFLGS